MFAHGSSTKPSVSETTNDKHGPIKGRKGKTRPSQTVRAIKRLHKVIETNMTPEYIRNTEIIQTIHVHFKHLLSKNTKQAICFIENVMTAFRRDLDAGITIASKSEISQMILNARQEADDKQSSLGQRCTPTPGPELSSCPSDILSTFSGELKESIEVVVALASLADDFADTDLDSQQSQQNASAVRSSDRNATGNDFSPNPIPSILPNSGCGSLAEAEPTPSDSSPSLLLGQLTPSCSCETVPPGSGSITPEDGLEWQERSTSRDTVLLLEKDADELHAPPPISLPVSSDSICKSSTMPSPGRVIQTVSDLGADSEPEDRQSPFRAVTPFSQLLLSTSILDGVGLEEAEQDTVSLVHDPLGEACPHRRQNRQVLFII